MNITLNELTEAHTNKVKSLTTAIYCVQVSEECNKTQTINELLVLIEEQVEGYTKTILSFIPQENNDNSTREAE